MTFPVVVFDWDGTLVDSEHHIVASLAHAAQQMALEKLSHDQLKSIIGLGLREAILALYPGLTDLAIEQYRQHYAEYYFSRPTGAHDLFADTLATLSALQQRGVTLAVATGKSRNGLERALTSTGLRPYFATTRCADETRSKPHPLMLQEICSELSVAPGDMIMVGDSSFDLEMAQLFGVASIGVSYGVHAREVLEAFQPRRIIDSLSELLLLYEEPGL